VPSDLQPTITDRVKAYIAGAKELFAPEGTSKSSKTRSARAQASRD